MQIDAVRRISIEATQKGVAESTAILKQLAAAQDGVAIASDRQEKSTLSVERALQKQQLSLDVAYRSSLQFEKAQRTLDQAQQQGLVTSSRHAELSALNAQRYGQVTGAQKAMTLTTQTLNLQVASLASGLGITGQVLAAFGPWGFAAAVGLGAVQAGLSLASDMSHKLAEKAKEIHEFSEATGLTTTQFQALRSEAGKFGVDAETLAGGLSKFTVGFQELRLGSGSLLTDINRINPALAEQMQQTTDTATAFTLFGQAVAQTSNIFERNALLKAGLGKGASTYGAFISSAPDVAALATAFAAAGKGIDENMIAKLKQLQIDIAKTQSAANTVFASMFGSSTLESELQFQKGLLSIATTLKGFEISADLRKFIDFITNPVTLTAIAALAAVGAIATAPASLPVAIGLGVTGAVAGAGAIVGGIRSAGGPVPAAPAVPAAAVATPSEAAAAAAAKTMQATATAAKNLADVLGSAASPAEKLNAALLGLKVKAADAGVSTEILDRGLAALNLDDVIARQNAHNSALGASASVTDIVAAKTLELVRAQQQGAGLTPKQISDQISLAREQALGTAQIKGQIDATNVQAATVGMSAGAAAAYTAKQTLLNDALRIHKDLSDADKASIDAQAAALGKSADAAERSRVVSQISFDNKTAFLSPQDVQIATALRGLYGDDIPAALGSSEAAAMRLNASMKNINDTIRDAAQSLAKDFVSGLVAGKSVMDSLGQAATNLSAKLTDKAIESLFSGDLLSAGIQGIGALVTGLFGASQKRREEEEKKIKESMERIAAYSQRAALAGLDTTTREGALQQFEIQANGQRADEAAKGNQAIAMLEIALAAERQAIVDKFNKDDLAAAQAAADAKAKAEQDAIAASLKRMQTYRDRIEATSVDTSTLAGALAAFDYKATQERADEIAAGGQAILDLTAAQEAERYNIYKSFNDASIKAAQDAADAQKKSMLAVQQYIDQVGKQIRDYLNGLKTGSSSTLNPQEKLNAAQAQFNQQYALAQAGDRTALGTITQYSQTLLDAAKSFFASSSGYSDVFDDVSAKLQLIPENLTVSQVSAADMIVDAIQQSKAATVSKLQDGTIQTIAAAYAVAGQTVAAVYDANGRMVGVTVAQTGAINTTTGAINATGASNDNLSAAQNALIAAQNALAAQQSAYLLTQLQLLTAINSLSDRTVNAMNGVGSIIANVANGHTEQFRQMVSLLAQQLQQGNSGGGTLWSWLGFANGGFIPGRGYADGGWISGGTPGKDSVRLASGDVGMPGEFVVRHDIAQANKSWLPAFNETGALPAVPAFRSGNDNTRSGAAGGLTTKDLAELARVLVAAFGEQTGALASALADLTEEVRRGTDENVVKQKTPVAAGGRIKR